MIICKETKPTNDSPCVLQQLMSKFALPKKDKCCKNYKEGKRCKRCPKR